MVLVLDDEVLGRRPRTAYNLRYMDKLFTFAMASSYLNLRMARNFLFFPILATSWAAAPEGIFRVVTDCWAF